MIQRYNPTKINTLPYRPQQKVVEFMSLDTESVIRIAKLARIGLTPQECAEVGSET